MSQQVIQFDVRRIRPDSPDFLKALHLAVGDEYAGLAAPSHSVSDMLAAAERGSCCLELAVGAYKGQSLESASVAMEFPGSASLVMFADKPPNRRSPGMNAALLRTLLQAAWKRSSKLLQVLIPPADKLGAQELAQAGFRFLTQLIYLLRSDGQAAPSRRISNELTWVSYSAEQEELFSRALELSYVESLDCPELTGLRTAPEILAGHRATGFFDASLWWVALRSSDPVGIALLNRVPSQPTMEIVYVGVTKEHRGTGVADALLSRMVAAAICGRAGQLTLAVDCRNTPARRMYERWGFRELSVMDAWIATARRL